MQTVFLGLGSNIGDREFHLVEAVRKLQETGIVVKRSSTIYETEPVGYVEQAPFLNVAIEVETVLSPMQLLEQTQRIEKELGRTRDIRWGPRTLDIDILLYGQEKVKESCLQIPHPRMGERAFVIVPLAEIAPDFPIPLSTQTTAAEMLFEIEGVSGVKPWKELVWAK
ncbi:2-amino-4-hydroxy-6-hydroxymethyldihydropteridine diphosphokinase [Aneurinibacillus terranovensis]|uniref:2-amino-4-hydroxy-6- hydroxymethyldihydropteridine diphosphokinase n=1 Tax=Aneurinibacillus terranovensis TaxID=278991 RepID=UPI00040E89C5|nr:2-amino-4-hydroxy-6-hydroxymethyldihydropteridine diphosphokinase [Aneurinibacillus terranovensis]